MSRVLRNPKFFAFRICENKGADQLHSNCEADQRLRFRYTDITMPLFLYPIFPVIRACTARFVSDLFGNHIVGFLMMRPIM